jgi:hypothetical protein
MSEVGRAEKFDLRSLNLVLDRSKRVTAAASVVFIGIVSIFLGVLLGFDGSSVASGSASALKVVVVIAGTVALSCVIGMLVVSLFRRGRGAELLVVSDSHLQVVLPGGRVRTLVWTDPETRIELYDYGTVKLPVATPYYLGLDQVLSALSAEAFIAIVGQVDRHNLVHDVRPASRWSEPTGVKIHQIRGGPPVSPSSS